MVIAVIKKYWNLTQFHADIYKVCNLTINAFTFKHLNTYTHTYIYIHI